MYFPVYSRCFSDTLFNLMTDTRYIASLLGFNTLGRAPGKGSPAEMDILSLPPDLRGFTDAQRLMGKVLGVLQDGTLRVDTEYGQIVLGGVHRPLPSAGQSVELRIDSERLSAKILLRATPFSKAEHSQPGDAERSNNAPIHKSLTPEALAGGAALTSEDLLSNATVLSMMPYDKTEFLVEPYMQRLENTLAHAGLELNAFVFTGGGVPREAFLLVARINPDAPALESGHRRAFDLVAFPDDATTPQSVVQHKPSRDKSAMRNNNAGPITPAALSFHKNHIVAFRHIAAQLISTSEHARLTFSLAPIGTPASLLPGAHTAMPKDNLHLYTPAFTPARAMQVQVIDIAPALAHVSEAIRISGGAEGIPEHSHFSYNPYRSNSALAGRPENNIVNAQVGAAHGVIEGFTQTRGFAVLRITAPAHFSGQLYALDQETTDLIAGTQLHLQIQPLSHHQKASYDVAMHPSETMTAPYFLTPGIWPIMEEVQQSLEQSGMPVAQAFQGVLPNAASASGLGAGVLFFVAALRSGDIQSWIGDKALETLRRSGHDSVFKRLKQELSGLMRLNEDRISGQWRALSIPVAWNEEIHRICVYTREEHDHCSDDRQTRLSGKSRFVIDLSLDQMGSVQIDGLFSRTKGDSDQSTAGRLDLILRTQNSFSQAMKQQMRRAYQEALLETQITGELSFQDHGLEWIRITPDEFKEYSAQI